MFDDRRKRPVGRGIWQDPLADDTLPVPAVRPGVRPPSGPRRRWRWDTLWPSDRRWSRRGLIAVAVLSAVLAATSALLAMGDPLLLAFQARPQPTRILPTATATLSPTPTLTPTVKPSPTENPLITGGINLGCIPGVLHPASYVVRGGPGAYNEVTLTFDDGPSIDPAGDWTSSILTTLEQTHTPATFFVVGASAHSRPNMIAREAADGTVAMHTWDHPYMTKLTPSARAWELSSTADAIHAALGPHYCLPYWRPPFGDYNSDVFAQAQAMGLTTVTWNVDPQDWSSPGVSVIVQRVLSAVQPGSIILLHDGYYGRWQTTQALPQIIQGLHARGLVPVTLPQLLSGAPPPAPAPTATTPAATPTPTATVTPTPAPTHTP